MTTLRLGTFSPSVLLDVARSSGGLAEEGLEVEDHPVPSSPAQFASLDADEYDAVFTSPDNIVAYRCLPSNPLGKLLDVEIVQMVDRGLGLCLALRPGGASPEPGLRFAVDVPQSGFAFAGFAMLDAIGLAPGQYEIVSLGSTPKRATALLAGECDATVLGAGNELRARSGGARIVAEATQLGPYLGTVLARRIGSAQSEAVDRFAAVLRRVASEIVSGQRADEAQASAERVLGLDSEMAREHVAVLRAPSTGLCSERGLDPAGIATIVDLRRRYMPDDALSSVTAATLFAA